MSASIRMEALVMWWQEYCEAYEWRQSFGIIVDDALILTVEYAYFSFYFVMLFR